MTDQVQRYPLTWPAGWKRTPAGARRSAEFRKTVNAVTPAPGQFTRTGERRLTIADALDRLERELRLLGASGEILSTNVRVGLKGLPLSSGSEPPDPGAAVYFKLNQRDVCLACDKWNRVADNVAAIAQHIDALRRIERYGIGTLDQAFAGYAALAPTAFDWWLILEVKPDATLDQVEKAYTRLAFARHPDRAGGSDEDMAKLNHARAIARQVLGARP